MSSLSDSALLPVRESASAVLSAAVAQLAEKAGLHERALPARVARFEAPDPTGSSQFVAASQFWTGPGIRALRVATITGPGADILNIALFPEPGSGLPLVQAELVVLRGRLFVLIADAMLLPGDSWTSSSTSPTRTLTRLAAEYPALCPGECERPEWCRDLISPEAVWARPNSEEALAPAVEALSELLDWVAEVLDHRDALRSDSTAARCGDAETWYARFRETFLEHEPSRPWLHRVFGEEISEPFMEEVLFPPAMTRHM